MNSRLFRAAATIGRALGGIFESHGNPGENYGEEWRVLADGDYEAYMEFRRQGHIFDWTDHGGLRPLHLAARGGNVEIIADLHKVLGHDINELSRDGKTPLDHAYLYQQYSAIAYFENPENGGKRSEPVEPKTKPAIAVPPPPAA